MTRVTLFHIFTNPSNDWLQRISLSFHVPYYIQYATIYVWLKYTKTIWPSQIYYIFWNGKNILIAFLKKFCIFFFDTTLKPNKWLFITGLLQYRIWNCISDIFIHVRVKSISLSCTFFYSFFFHLFLLFGTFIGFFTHA